MRCRCLEIQKRGSEPLRPENPGAPGGAQNSEVPGGARDPEVPGEHEIQKSQEEHMIQCGMMWMVTSNGAEGAKSSS